MAVKKICHASRGESNLAVSREVMVGQVMGHPNLVGTSSQSAGSHTGGLLPCSWHCAFALNCTPGVYLNKAIQSLPPTNSKVNPEWPAESLGIMIELSVECCGHSLSL